MLTQHRLQDISKALARRLSKVITKFILGDHYAFIKGSNIATSQRGTDDISNYLDAKQLHGLLVAKDFMSHPFSCMLVNH